MTNAKAAVYKPNLATLHLNVTLTEELYKWFTHNGSQKFNKQLYTQEIKQIPPRNSERSRLEK